MSCYLRHLKDILGEAGIEVTPANRERVDRAIHQIAGIGYKDCPETWKWVKRQLADDRQRRQLISRLQSVYNSSRSDA